MHEGFKIYLASYSTVLMENVYAFFKVKPCKNISYVMFKVQEMILKKNAHRADGMVLYYPSKNLCRFEVMD